MLKRKYFRICKWTYNMELSITTTFTRKTSLSFLVVLDATSVEDRAYM